jgi:hypothetical protein
VLRVETTLFVQDSYLMKAADLILKSSKVKVTIPVSELVNFVFPSQNVSVLSN